MARIRLSPLASSAWHRTPWQRGAAAGATVHGFTPTDQGGLPPAGSYDPALDAATNASDRGLFDLGQDTALANRRDLTDYGTGIERIGQGFDRQTADEGQQYGRGVEDLARGMGRATEDHARQVAMLQQSYQRRAQTQLQAQNRAGVLGGGAALQAAAKRQANEAQDQQPIDQSFQRYGEDNATSRARLEQGHATFGQRSVEDRDQSLASLALDYAPPDENNPFGGRRYQDRIQALQRGGRENQAFHLDTDASKIGQAAAAGWAPPVPPRNEFMGATGPYQLRRQGAYNVRVDPSGRVLKRIRR